VVAGKFKTEIVETTASELDKKELAALEPGANVLHVVEAAILCDQGNELASHLMFFVAGDHENLGRQSAGSPVKRRMTLKNG